MRKILKKMIYFGSEPHSMSCPRCSVWMDWNAWQGVRGGWVCPDCGLQIDYK